MSHLMGYLPYTFEQNFLRSMITLTCPMGNRAVRKCEKFVTLNLIFDFLITEEFVTLGFYCMCLWMEYVCARMRCMCVRMACMCVRMACGYMYVCLDGVYVC